MGDGIEMSFWDLKGHYGSVPEHNSVADAELVETVRRAADRAGVCMLGATYHITDGNEGVCPSVPGVKAPDFADADLVETLEYRLARDKQLGAGYINFQIWLPPKYMHTPLAWRDDDEYLRATVDRAVRLQKLCWKHGLNAYFETHIDRWGEDPIFFRKVLEAGLRHGGFEVNGDLSHYLYRNFTQGPDVQAVLEKVNHLHVRIARIHGDLSAETLDPHSDFNAGGPTRAQWDMILTAGPLSSRTVCGESGPLHLVTNPLDQDARLVPMLRAIAAAKDGSTVHLANDFNPFPK